MNRQHHARVLLPLAAAMSLTLAACGGGGGAGSAHMTSLAGAAIDSPIAAAQITITAGAPLGDAGASTIGTVTADAAGNWSASVNLPSGSVPVFANAASPSNATLVLSSYIGQSDALAAAGTLTTANLPDLDVTPVSTAALAVYAATSGNSYSGLTPTSYAASLSASRADVLVIAAAIKAIGDGLCTPASSVTSTTNLAAALAAAANLSSSTPTTLTAAANALGGSCATTLAGLQQLIADDPRFGPELELGDIIDAGASSVAPGSYVLQGVLAESGLSSGSISSGSLTSGVAAAPAAVFTDGAVNIDASGSVSSSDGNVAGTMVGNLLNLVIVDAGRTYTLRGKIGAVPTGMLGSGSAYSLQAGGSNAISGVLTGFEGVLASPTATPAWNGMVGGSDNQQGVQCASGLQPLRMEVFAPGMGGGSLGECVSASASSWTLSTPNSTSSREDFEEVSGALQATSAAQAALSPAPQTWSGGKTTPFILTNSGVSLALPSNGGTASLSGTIYYAMGSHSAILSTGTRNVLLNLHDVSGLRLSEDMGGGQRREDH